MTIDELMQGRPWFNQSVNLEHQPAGMLGGHESLLCYYLAKDAFRGHGTIVDAGSFLGRSAFFFAEGLRNNPRYVAGRDRIHCFDNFLVNEEGTVEFIQNELNEKTTVGDSTRSIFEAQVAPIRDLLEIHAGDFHEASWPHKPIEILMVDIAKSKSLGQHVVKVFFPNLIPGESLVMHQDYHHPWLPHIHVVMEYLADYFELIAPRVDDSALFRYRKLIPAEVLRRAIDNDFTYEEQLGLMDRAIVRLPEADRFYVELARIILQCGKTEGAILHGELDRLELRFQHGVRDYTQNPYFAQVREHIDEAEGWRQKDAGNFQRALQLADSLISRRRNTNSLTMRGCALIGLKRYSEAEQVLREALEVRPPSGFAYIELARALMLQDRLDEAETHILSGLRDRSALDATTGHYLDMLDSIWGMKNDPDHETRILEQLLREMPDDPEVRARTLRRGGSESGTAAKSAGALSGKPWLDVVLPAAVVNKKSMLSLEEKQYLTWLTAEKYEGWGAIVELGCWLGGSSIALAEGLRRRRATNKIQTFDLFRWETYMEEAAQSDLKPGDDFLPLYLREVGKYTPWIHAKKQDLMDYTWNGGPIEILFVDSAKTWELVNAVLRGFGPSLVPGRSRVVLQDFRYHWSHCLPLIFDSRPDLWKEVEQVDGSPTVTFLLLKPLDGPAGIHADYSEDAFPLASADHLLRSRIAREDPVNRPPLTQTLYRKYLIDGSLEQAQQLRAEVLASGVDAAELATIEDVEGVLLPRGWSAYGHGDYDVSKAIAERLLCVPAKKSIHSSTLLGFSLLRLGDRPGAKRCFDQVLSSAPDFYPARLFQVEFALGENRYDDAESQALDVLRTNKGDEAAITWSLNLLEQAWTLNGADGRRSKVLKELADAFGHSPSFLTHLAQHKPPEAHQVQEAQAESTVLTAN